MTCSWYRVKSVPPAVVRRMQMQSLVPAAASPFFFPGLLDFPEARGMNGGSVARLSFSLPPPPHIPYHMGDILRRVHGIDDLPEESLRYRGFLFFGHEHP